MTYRAVLLAPLAAAGLGGDPVGGAILGALLVLAGALLALLATFPPWRPKP